MTPIVPELTRRGLLAVASAAAAPLLLPLPALAGSAAPPLESAVGGLVVDHPAGGVVVLEPRANRLLRSGPGGFTYAVAGPGPFQLNRPRALVVARDGTLWVANGGNGEVLCFSADGEPLRRIGDLGAPRALALTPDGETLLVADVTRRRVLAFGLDGAPRGVRLDALYGPTGLAVAPDGTLFVAEQHAQRLLVVAPDGHAVAVTLREPLRALAADGAGGVYLAVGATVHHRDAAGRLRPVADAPAMVDGLALGSALRLQLAPA